MNNTAAPRTLTEAVIYFANESDAHAYVANLRWPDGKQVCPKCGVINAHYFLKARNVWKCKDCRKQFSVKVGTIFEDSPLPLSKWLPAMWLLANCKNGVSSYEVSRALKVTQKTAWFMLHRLRLALQSSSGGKLNGTVEVDTTLIGGRAHWMHKSRRERVIRGRGFNDKVSVLGLLERGQKGKSRVRCSMTGAASGPQNRQIVRQNVEPHAALHSDTDHGFLALAQDYAHQVVNHTAKEWVRGAVHTNGIENFWSLLKRTIRGTYVCPAPFHTFRYLDEQAFRFNERSMTDGERFNLGLRAIGMKRLTYAALTGAGVDRRRA